MIGDAAVGERLLQRSLASKKGHGDFLTSSCFLNGYSFQKTQIIQFSLSEQFPCLWKDRELLKTVISFKIKSLWVFFFLECASECTYQ